jgi:exosome complex component RRP42
VYPKPLKEGANKMDKVRKTFGPTAERIKEFLSKDKRFDGRKKEEFRDLILEKDVSKKAEGSVRVKLGKTEVIVGVKIGTAEPYPDSPNKGNLMVTAELLPLSSPRFESGPPRFPAIELGRVTDRFLRESGFIDFEKLCIKKGEKVWNIFVDIYSINDDGNLLDAAGIGAVVALNLAKIPKYDEKEDKILYGELTDKGLPLIGSPVSVTIHKIGDNLIVDPTREEEDLSDTRFTIGFLGDTIASTQKGGSVALSVEETKKVFELADKISKEVFKKIEKSLK